MAKGWRNSTAKRQLECDLIRGTIPLDANVMGAREVHSKRAVFQTFPYEQFRDRLNDLRKAIKKKMDSANADAVALQRDRQLFPTLTHDENGRRRWEGSDAERLLKVDMKNDLHNMMRPKALYELRWEYSQFDLQTFRGHIHQAKKTKVFRSYVEGLQKKKDEGVEIDEIDD